MKIYDIEKEIQLIITAIENYVKDEFHIYYETDVENTLNDLKKLLRRIKNENEKTDKEKNN